MKTACLVISISLLSGCMVGPNFTPPKSETPATWRQGKAESQTAATEISAQWWSLFHDPLLTRLIERASQSNLDLRAASARLLQAQAARQIISGDSTPTVTGAASYQRARNSQKGLQDISGLDGKKAYSVWQPGVDVSWELDMWGRVRRELESANASVEASAELRRDVQLSIQAETARDYIQLRSVQAQRNTTEQNLALAQHSLKLTAVKMRDGVATRLEGAEAQAQVALIQARLPILDQQQSRLINALSFLLGEQPGALNAELSAVKALPLTPAKVPVGLPSELTRRRPDIRAAEAKLHAATADIGIATADFYPRLTLSGDVGLQAMQFSQLGSWGAHYFSFGPSLTLPIFEGGRLRGQLALRKAQQQEAANHFQSTVLKAWHEVDDAMVDYDTYQQQRNQLKIMVDNDRLALNAAQQQYVGGATDFLNVLTVQKELLNAEKALVVSDAEVSLSIVQLYKALGGGWTTEQG
ncbi:efflux transporter outer membrane subunit [Rouxiella sp. T17]|uniref:efflux transporter outer membrane subunit n=1 Tax=Rouxiella sp. T17 TaxID=3085684 RepID=UPI002FC901A8